MTSLIVLLLLSTPIQTKEDNASAIAFIRRHQLASGGFATRLPTAGGEQVASLRTSRTALRALRLLGADNSHQEAVLQYLKNCYSSKTGGFADRPGAEPDPVSTSVALMILQECNQPVAPYLDRALQFMAKTTRNFEELRMVASGLEETHRTLPEANKAWLKLIDENRLADGTYGEGPGKARTTALRVVAKQRLGMEVGDTALILQTIRAGQRADGGFGSDKPDASDLESCYRIVRLFSRLNAQPDRPEALRGFIQRCHHADGGYGVQPDAPSSLHGTYYATIIRHWLNGGK